MGLRHLPRDTSRLIRNAVDRFRQRHENAAGTAVMMSTCPERLRDYLECMESVRGWLGRLDVFAMAECLRIQDAEGITGAIAEIGVHHGKSFLALANAARDGDQLYAIDVFERQDLNIDGSGAGHGRDSDRRKVFMANVERFAPRVNLTVLAMSSLDLRRHERDLLAPLRFLSIDGGHTRDVTLNDLEVADAALVEGGMCCADDVLNHEWTGVVSGICAFLAKSSTLVPFALTSNKLYFCRPSYHDARRTMFRETFRSVLVKERLEFGCSPYLVDFYR
jgi:methyltransferase family protein